MNTDTDKFIYLRANEALRREIDASPYLLTSQYVTAGTVTHTPPSGSADTLSVSLVGDPTATSVILSSLGPLTALGWHLVDVALTLTGGEVKVFRYRIWYAG